MYIIIYFLFPLLAIPSPWRFPSAVRLRGYSHTFSCFCCRNIGNALTTSFLPWGHCNMGSICPPCILRNFICFSLCLLSHSHLRCLTLHINREVVPKKLGRPRSKVIILLFRADSAFLNLLFRDLWDISMQESLASQVFAPLLALHDWRLRTRLARPTFSTQKTSCRKTVSGICRFIWRCSFKIKRWPQIPHDSRNGRPAFSI